jgi:AraC-like DNA-binding protein
VDPFIRLLVRIVFRRLRTDEEVSVSAVAGELGFTRQCVSGRFRRATGILLVQYLKERRLRKAARLLRSGRLRIFQVARLCGFDSDNYFRKEFKIRFGISPRPFRNDWKRRRRQIAESCGQPGAGRSVTQASTR